MDMSLVLNGRGNVFFSTQTYSVALASENSMDSLWSQEPLHQSSNSKGEPELDIFLEIGTEVSTVQTIGNFKLVLWQHAV